MNIFEYASRKKIRFNYKGTITTEDLWDLPVTALDSIYKQLNAELKTANEDSLLSAKSAASTVLETQIEIVKHIVAEKLADVKRKEKAKENRDQKAKLMEILEEKQNEALRSKSAEELIAMISAMED